VFVGDVQVLPGFGPVPGQLGTDIHRHIWDVAGLARHAIRVQVEAHILMGLAAMAAAALDGICAVYADRHGAPGYPMLFGPVAVHAKHILPAHVNIDPRTGKKQGGVQNAMLYGVGPTSLEMAPAAVVSLWNADASGRCQQVNALVRLTGTILFLPVAAAVVMADQAVDTGGVIEIEMLIFPAITYVTTGTGRPVGLYTDTEIVDDVALADAYGLFVTAYPDFLTLPVPMGGCHDFRRYVFVTFDACPSNCRAVREGGLKEG